MPIVTMFFKQGHCKGMNISVLIVWNGV